MKTFDTNRLIDAYRGGESLNGYTTILNLIEFPKAIEFNLRVMFPSKSDYHLALKISTELLKAGKPIPAVDSVIAAALEKAQKKKLDLTRTDEEKELFEYWFLIQNALTS